MLYVINAEEEQAIKFYKSKVSSEKKGKIFRWNEFVKVLDYRDQLFRKYDSLCVLDMASFFKEIPDEYEADMIGMALTTCIKTFEFHDKHVYLVNPAPITEENYGLGWICDLKRHKVIKLKN